MFNLFVKPNKTTIVITTIFTVFYRVDLSTFVLQMSAGDYTTLLKLRQLQGNFNASTLPGPTGPRGETGPMGETGPTGSANGGMFTIIAESSNGFDTNTANGFTFSFGSGAKSINGIQIGAPCTLNYIGVQLAEAPSTMGILQIWKNKTYTNVSINNILSSCSKTDVNLPLLAGDSINIKCAYGSGGGAISVSLWFSTIGLVGVTGPTGPVGYDTGRISELESKVNVLETQISQLMNHMGLPITEK